MNKLLGFAFLCAAFLFAPVTSRAQDAQAEGEAAITAEVQGEAAMPPEETVLQAEVTAAPPSDPAWAAQPAPAQPAVATDGVRFRGAIAASGGAEFASGFEVGMGGLEGRVGVQFTNLIGVYFQPSLAFGAGAVNGTTATVFTGTAGISMLIDFTIADYFFVAAGGGVGILNNPVAPEIHLRVGGYPVMVRGEDGYSRQGLMVGVDARVFLLPVGADLLPVTQILASIGYEVF